MNPIKYWKNRTKDGLLENTIMLFIMQFTNLFLGMLTTGHQTRVLKDENFGILSTALTIMMFFQLFLDFGFIQSATGKIAANRNDKAFISKIFTCVTVIKLIFTVISAIALAIFLAVNNVQGVAYWTYWLCLLSTVTNSLMGEYMYKGLERMSAITYRAVGIKIFSVAMIFVFMKQKDQYYMVPLFTAIGNIIAMVFVHWHLFNKMHIHLTPITPMDVWEEIKSSAHFFFSRIATTVYSQMNLLILRRQYGNAYAGYYRAGDTITSAAKVGIVGPITDSLYPHMMRNKNFSLIKKTLLFGLPILTAGCAVVFAIAPWFCNIWLDSTVAPNATIALRGLIPTVILALPNYLLGFPTLGAMGLSKYVNNSTIIGTIVHIINLSIFAFTGNLTIISLCLLTGFTEVIVLCYRILVIYKNRGLLRAPTPKQQS